MELRQERRLVAIPQILQTIQEFIEHDQPGLAIERIVWDLLPRLYTLVKRKKYEEYIDKTQTYSMPDVERIRGIAWKPEKA